MSLSYASKPASFLANLTKNLTSQYHTSFLKNRKGTEINFRERAGGTKPECHHKPSKFPVLNAPKERL
jgi:hypothetical protein